jgi:hypothetical protein
MSLPFIIHSIYLIFSVFVTFLWVQNPALSPYTLQLIGFFVLIYIASHFWRQQKEKKVGFWLSAIDSFIFLLVILLLVLSTGGLASPLFFLLYFLLFSLSMIWEPSITFVFTAALIVFFLYSYPNLNSHQLASLTSLILITPLSLFFGQQYIKVLEQKGQIKILADKFIKTNHDVSEQETNTLLWLSLNFKQRLHTIIDNISHALEDPQLSHRQREKLTKALNESKKILCSGTVLEEKIDQQTDE